MRNKLFMIAAVGFLALSSIGGQAQDEVAPAESTAVAEAQDAAIAACSTGAQDQCSAALQSLAATIRSQNPALTAENLDGWILSSYRNVAVSVRAAGGPAVNIAAIDRLAPPVEDEPAGAPVAPGTTAPAVGSDSMEEVTPSSSPQ